MKKIGTSLSKCILSIAKGEISEDDVLHIVAGTRCRDWESWRRVLQDYKKEVWTQDGVDPEHAYNIAIWLIGSGRVSQPRLIKHYHFPITNGQIWFDTMDQIKYIDDVEEVEEGNSPSTEPLNRVKWTPCYKQVTCKKCARTYTCLPEDDYFNSTCSTNGVCESCLKIDFKVSEILPATEII